MESQVRTSILKTAETLFVKFGIRSVSIDDICRELQMSKKTFYCEFEQKADLVEAVCGRIVGRQHSEKQQAQLLENNDNPIDAIFCYRRPIQWEIHRKYAAFFYDLNKYYPEIQQKRVAEKKDEIRRVLSEFLTRGMEQGWFRQDMDVKLMTDFLSRWQSTTSAQLQELEPGEVTTFVDLVSDALVRVVCSDKGMVYYAENYLSKQ